jgi:hypothetical protein
VDFLDLFSPLLSNPVSLARRCECLGHERPVQALWEFREGPHWGFCLPCALDVLKGS